MDKVYHFEIIPFVELEKIEHRSVLPNHQFLWLWNWYTVFKQLEDNDFGYQKKVIVILAYQDEQLIAVLPLVQLKRKYWGLVSLTFLEFLGQQWSSFGNDIILTSNPSKEFVPNLKRWLRKNQDYNFLLFKYLPSSSILVNHFHFYKYGGAPFLQLDKYESYAAFSKVQYNRKMRENLRRVKKLAIRNGIFVEEVVENINKKNFEEIKRVSRSKLSDGKTSLYGQVHKEQFYRTLFNTFPSQVAMIKFDGKAVAYCANILWKGVIYGLDSGYDRNLRRYSLGNWCLDCCIRNGFDKGYGIYSLGSGLDSYKIRFADSIKVFYFCFDWKPCLRTLLAFPYFLYRIWKKDKEIERTLQKVDYDA